MAKIQYAPKAVEDLRGLWEYVAFELEMPEAADGIRDQILVRIRSLEQFPLLGASVEAVSGRKTDLRFLPVGKRVVVYRAERETVYIMRVFSGGANWIDTILGSAFSGEEDT